MAGSLRDESRSGDRHAVPAAPFQLSWSIIRLRKVFEMSNPDDESPIPPDWLAEFQAAARRPLPLRMKYAFIKTYKPVMDDAKFRAFDTTADYRKWCEENLPDWLGYGRV
jgi:hypothetical protein